MPFILVSKGPTRKCDTHSFRFPLGTRESPFVFDAKEEDRGGYGLHSFCEEQPVFTSGDMVSTLEQ
jgi:hypothetical protein